MRLVDTHCHLFLDPLSRDVEGVRQRAVEAGVEDLVVPAYDLATWSAIRELKHLPGIHAALGLHPWVANRLGAEEIGDEDGEIMRLIPSESAGSRGAVDPDFKGLSMDEIRDRLAAALEDCAAVAVGEIGLDNMIRLPAASEQMALLRAQLSLAADMDLPVILHCRSGWENLVGALQPYAGKLRGVLHSYTRVPELAGPFLKVGFYVGIGGTVTRPDALRTRRSAMELPLDRIVLETDAPTTGLHEREPGATEPCHLVGVAQTVADIRGLSLSEVAAATSDNARELFRI